MPSLACCYTDDETPYCAYRREHGLPMCDKHMRATFEAAILDGLLPIPIMRELAMALENSLIQRTIASGREALARVESRTEQIEYHKRNVGGVVYYVRVRPGVIKIGTTNDLARRVSTLRLDRGALLAAEPGGIGVERDRHHDFADLRQGRREDFEETPRLLDHIATLREAWGDPWTVEAVA